MKQFWLCLFLITSFFLYAEDAVTRATSYGAENVTVDTVTSATEYAGTPKVFKNGKSVDNHEKIADKQSKQIIPEEKIKSKPEVVVSERTDDEALKIESAMHFLPETFEQVLPAESVEKKIPSVAVPYYQSYFTQSSQLPMSKELIPAEIYLGENSLSEMKNLPVLYEKMLAEVLLSEGYTPEMEVLPEVLEKVQPTVVLAEEASEINSEMKNLPVLYEKMPAEVSLSEDYTPEMEVLPEALEKVQPTVVLAEEASEISSEMKNLPALYEKMPAEVSLSEDYTPEMEVLPETLEKTQPTVVLADKATDSASTIGADMVELPLPEAIFEEKDKKEDDLPFIWEEDVPEEEDDEEEFRDEDLPTLLDVPEVTLGDSENTELFDVPDVNYAENDVAAIEEVSDDILPEENIHEDVADNESVNIEDLAAVDNIFEDSNERDSSKSDELAEVWKNEKDYRKLMDFNEEFNDFPKTVEDVFNNPAQYLYDSNELVVESGKKIDDLTGKQLFDSAVKCIKEKEYEKAAKLLKELLHYNYSVPETEYLLALAEFKNGNAACAMKYLQRSDRKNKNPYLIAKNSELEGEIYFSQSKYDKAYECFINAIIGVNSKQDAELYNKAGIAALRAGNIEKARKAWKTGKFLGNRDAKRNLLWLDH